MERHIYYEVVEFLRENRPSIERVRIRNEEVQVYGVMPNSNQKGWYFLAYELELLLKGLPCLL